MIRLVRQSLKMMCLCQSASRGTGLEFHGDKWILSFDPFDWDFIEGKCRKRVKHHRGVCTVRYWCIGPFTIERVED